MNNRNLIAVGRFSKEKGFIKMIDIIYALKNYYPDITLHLVGDGIERKNIEGRVKELGCNECVVLHGFQNKEYINKWYKKSAIYIMTSFEEALPFVLIEAQYFGLPCIAYDSARGAREIIEDGVSGYLINNRDQVEFVNKIRLLLDNKAMYKSMSEEARKNSTQYLKENVEMKWLEIINGAPARHL